MDFTETEPILRDLSMARQADVDPLTVDMVLGWSSRCGLIDDEATRLTDAGWQYLDLDGQVSIDVLNFLPDTIDDLHARRAVLVAGADAVATFRGCLLSGTGIEHARDLVPSAYVPCVDWEMTLGLYAATAAVVARLSAQEPAACVAEEICLVNLVDSARKWLIVDGEIGELGRWQAERAKRALIGLFKLGRDPALPGLFASRTMVSSLGLAAAEVLFEDYPPEGWFRAYPGACPTGHLDFTQVE